ncbi:unnamed protein product [Pocillopora meandrina]|uniref:Uncharacterized protein n=1 Tax=Pocillopora meandrina TaxID=46732 RepID=A0AAU9VQV7_9CNID|nr:unnamed protein product [Pocillopora meandrina]
MLVYIAVWKEPKFVATVMMFTHYVKYCEEFGIQAGAASRLFVYYGIASYAGRLVSGRLCAFEKVNTFYVRYCEDIGITQDAASRLFVYYRLSLCAGRLVSSRLCDFKMIHTFFVYQIAEIGMSIPAT